MCDKALHFTLVLSLKACVEAPAYEFWGLQVHPTEELADVSTFLAGGHLRNFF